LRGDEKIKAVPPMFNTEMGDSSVAEILAQCIHLRAAVQSSGG